jgi:hypothetical protein
MAFFEKDKLVWYPKDLLAHQIPDNLTTEMTEFLDSYLKLAQSSSGAAKNEIEDLLNKFLPSIISNVILKSGAYQEFSLENGKRDFAEIPPNTEFDQQIIDYGKLHDFLAISYSPLLCMSCFL